MSIENPFEQNPINNNEVKESVEEVLTPEEKNAVQKGVEMYTAIAEYDNAATPMIARGQGKQLSEIYGDKFRELGVEYDAMRSALSAESNEKVRIQVNKALEERGISLESKL